MQLNQNDTFNLCTKLTKSTIFINMLGYNNIQDINQRLDNLDDLVKLINNINENIEQCYNNYKNNSDLICELFDILNNLIKKYNLQGVMTHNFYLYQILI